MEPVDAEPHAFLTSALNAGERTTSGRFTPWKYAAVRTRQKTRWAPESVSFSFFFKNIRGEDARHLLFHHGDAPLLSVCQQFQKKL